MLTGTRNSLCAILAFMVVSSGFCLPELTSNVHHLRTNPNNIRINQKPIHSHSNISADYIIEILRVFVTTSNRDLTFLYGQEYEEVINGLSELVATEFVVLMNLKNDGNTETLRQILAFPKRKNFLLLLDTPANIISLFEKMRKKMLKTHSVAWILLMEADDSDARLQEFVNEGTQVIIFVKTSDGNMILYLPSVDASGITRFTNRGRWDATKDLKKIFSEEPQKSYDLSGRHFKVAVKEITMVIKVGRAHTDGSVELLSGAEVDILKVLGSALNFTYKAFLPRDNVWGYVLPDGNVTGIIGMVARREAALGISALSFSDSRISAIDFTTSYHVGRFLLMSRFPKEKNKPLAILSPFKLQIWVCVTLAVLLIGPVMYSMAFLLNKYMAADVKLDFQWFQFNMFRNIVNQGNSMSEDALQVRVVLLFWFLFCFIISAIYSGMLTAVLAIPAYETPIDSLQDLPRAVKEGFTVGTLGGSNYEALFKSATEGVLKQTWDLFDHKDRSRSFVGNVYTGIRRVLEEKFVFIISDTFARAFETTFGEKKFHLSREKLFPSYLGIVCQKGSPITDTLSHALIKMTEGGLIKKILTDAYRKIPKEPSTKETETTSSSITLTHLQAAFYMLSLGLILSTVVMLLERLTLCINRKKKDQV